MDPIVRGEGSPSREFLQKGYFVLTLSRFISLRCQRSQRVGREVERVEGIEPSTKAWEAFVLPLNYTRSERLTLYQMFAGI